MKRGIAFLLFLACVLPAGAAHAAQLHAHARQKIVALTFDDGPYGTSTEQVLQILQQEKVHATFFLIGRNVAEFPDEARRIVASGNVIGNHTYTHTDLSTITNGQALGDIARAQVQIASTTGTRPLLFRPPYGILPNDTRDILKAQGYRIIMWNDDPEDWNYASSTKDAIVSRVLAQEKKNEKLVVILHDGRDTHINYPRQNMIQALPVVIENLKQQGYVFVTADKL
ncbi:MAG: polysaccharide deacetylase [Parcubacteria group bacterium]|nr:polysaccharide deacetylase [Parcubacteria group bacterium]